MNVRKEAIFYNAEAIMKNNVDDNGLYLNDITGYKGYSSPYHSVSIIPQSGKFLASIHIIEDYYRQMLSDSRIHNNVVRGLIPDNVLASNPKDRIKINLGTYDDARDAAYIAQYFRFHEDAYELLVKYFLDRFVNRIEDPLADIEIPEWEFKAVGREYDPTDKKYKPNVLDLMKAKAEMDAQKKAEQDKKILEENKKRYLEIWKRAGYNEDSFNNESIKLIISGKIK